MQKQFYTIVIIFLFLSGFQAKAIIAPPDSIHTETGYSTEDQLIINLDSLMNSWYVKQSLSMPSVQNHSSSVKVGIVNDSVYAIRLAKLPSLIHLPYNPIVGDYIRLYTERIKKKTEVLIGLTDYYFPLFESVLDAQNLPHELKYLPIIESALNPRAVSKAGATGLWQFMYTTGRLYGLNVNSFVDERRDPTKSTYAAARYLKELYNLYNDWTLVIAAYNCGPGTVNKAIKRSNGKTNYWDLYYYLPKETRGYVPCFIAAAYFMNYYSEHGLVPVKISMPKITDTIMIYNELHMEQVSSVLDIPLDQLHDLNPLFKTDIIPECTDGYPLRLPAQLALRFIDMQDSIFSYKDSVFFTAPRSVTTPTPVIQPKPVATTATSGSSGYSLVYYTVRSGDNLGYIADWYDVTITQIRQWNHLSGNMIRPGQKLTIKVPESKADRYRSINSMTFEQKQRLSNHPIENEPNKPAETNTTSEYIKYTVKSGDTPWSISRKYPGVSPDEIIKLNNISNSHTIHPGDVIKIPKK